MNGKTGMALIVATALGALITLGAILYSTGATNERHKLLIDTNGKRIKRVEYLTEKRLDRIERKIDKINEKLK